MVPRRPLTGAFGPPAVALLAVAAFTANRSGLDFALARLFFDGGSGTFRWRDHPLFAIVLHDAAKWLAVALAVALALLLAASRRPALAAWRSTIAFALVASLAAALAVSLLKSRSSHSCPWDLAVFGGNAAFFPLLADVPAQPGPGKCVPSGHGSTGFMWIGAVYALRRSPLPAARRDALQRRAALLVALFGSLVSFTQVVRGAHFVSHVLLTAAVCWAVAWGFDRAWPAKG